MVEWALRNDIIIDSPLPVTYTPCYRSTGLINDAHNDLIPALLLVMSVG